jgi:hypothetical protein
LASLRWGWTFFHSLNRTLDQAQGRLDEDGNPITTRGLDAINVAGIAPLGGIAAGGGKALAAGLAANRAEAAAPLAMEAMQPVRAYRGMQMDRQQGAKSDTMFGSSDPEVAASYANQVEDPRFGSSFESGAMMPLDMNFNNPMRVDAGGNYWSEIPYNGDFASTDQLVSKARALGHDGLIVDNVKDALTRGSEPATTYAAIGRGTVRSPLTGETLFSNPDEAVPLSLGLNALDQQAPKGIKAYHGSPHDFDKFSLDAIGTGEGVQAYGHGMYFTDTEDIAKGYRNNLTADVNSPAQRLLGQHNGDIDAAVRAAQTEADRLRGLNLTPESGAATRDQKVARQEENIQALLRFKNEGSFNPGRMYEVNINASPDDLLDWDKPLSQQSEKVRGALSSVDYKDPGSGWSIKDYAETIGAAGSSDKTKHLLNDRSINKTGSDILNMLGTYTGKGDPVASNVLREAGIPGIRYLDGNSRNAGQGSYNYVIFDPDLIEIQRKYANHPDAAKVSAALEAMQAERDQQQQGPVPLHYGLK